MEKIVLPYNEGLQKEIKEIGLELQGEQNIMVVNSMGPTAYKTQLWRHLLGHQADSAAVCRQRGIGQMYVGHRI